MLRYRLLNILFQLSNMTKKHILCLIQLLLPINGIGDWSPTGLIFAVFQRSFSVYERLPTGGKRQIAALLKSIQTHLLYYSDLRK